MAALSPVGDVPRGQRVVHGEERADRTGGRRDARRRVHRVVDRGGAVGVADDVEVHEVGALRPQAVVGEPPGRGEVGEEDAGVVAGRGDERGGELAALGPRQVDAIERLPLLRPAQ